jgi:probable HAF family extracellular repeat protein
MRLAISLLACVMGAAAMCQAGTLTFSTIDYPGALASYANGINSSGDIVGLWLASLDGFGQRAFLQSGGVFTTLLGASAFGINNNGVIVGSNGGSGSFIYDNGNYQMLCIPSAFTQATGINDSGEIVGSYRNNANVTHGFLYKGGAFTTINVPGANFTVINGINNKGQMVGEYSTAPGIVQGFLYDGSTFTTIDAPCAPADYCDTELHGINDSGEIVGSAPVALGVIHGSSMTILPSHSSRNQTRVRITGRSHPASMMPVKS